MMMRRESWLALFAALLIVACGPGDTQDQLPEAEMFDAEPYPEVEAYPEAEPYPETEAYPEAEPTEPEDTLLDPTAGEIEQEFSVTNNTPHVMIVFLIDDGETREITRLDPEATEALVVEGEAGTEITFIATDEDETHTVDFTLEVGALEPPTWEIDSDS
jgi:hypothetical protein